MTHAVKPIPEGYHTVTPHIVVRGAEEAIAFYARAFGAEETVRMPGPGGKLLHAEVRIGDSVVMLSDEFPEMGARSPQSIGGTSGGLMLYVNDVDAAFARAVGAGATAEMPPQDMFWGDRYGKLRDPFGHSWSLATHVEDLDPDEMMRRMQEAVPSSPQS